MLFRKLRSFWCRPLFEQIWFLPVWLLLGGNRLLIKLIPLRYFVNWVGVPFRDASFLPLIQTADAPKAEALGRTVQLAARYTPWESNCFPQALTACCLLKCYGIPYSLFFGVQKTPALAAHAWVRAGRVCVAGGESFSQFAVVSCFVSPIAASAP